MAYKRELPTFNQDPGNPKGYNKDTSPYKTGAYEKKLDTVGSGSTRTIRMISGDGKIIGQERLGTSAGEKLARKYKIEKEYTNRKRLENKQFLESREAIGKSVKK